MRKVAAIIPREVSVLATARQQIIGRLASYSKQLRNGGVFMIQASGRITRTLLATSSQSSACHRYIVISIHNRAVLRHGGWLRRHRACTQSSRDKTAWEITLLTALPACS